MGYFDPASPSEVPVKMELLLQLQNLLPRVSSAGAFGFPSFAIRIH